MKKALLSLVLLATSLCLGQSSVSGGSVQGGNLGVAGIGILVLNPNSLACPSTNVGSNSTCSFVLVNTGGASITTLAVGNPTGANAADFGQTNNCGTSLAIGNSCSVTVTFTPSATGTRTASIAITSSLPTTNVALSGVGTSSAPIIVVSPLSLTFSGIPTGTTSAPQTVTYTNQGPGSVTVSTVALTGANATDFAQTNNCTLNETFSGGALNSNWVIDTGSAPGGGANNTSTFSSSNVDLSQGMLGLELTQTGTLSAAVSTGAEVRSVNKFGYGTYQWTARMSSTSTTPNGAGSAASGSVSGLFNFFSGGYTEDDFEVEGQFPTKLEMTSWINASTNTTGSATEAGMDGAFHTYKFVWAPGRIDFYFDGTLVQTNTTNVPSAPAYVMFNHWGTNSASFGGTASIGVTRWLYVSNFSYTALPAGQSCNFNVTFSPSLAGGQTETGNLQINDTSATGQQNVALTGTVVASPAPNTNLQPPSSYQWFQFVTNTAEFGSGLGPVTSLAELTFYGVGAIPRSNSLNNWVFSADSTDSTSSPKNAADSNAGTFWITNTSGVPGQPHTWTVNTANSSPIVGFAMTPRQDGCDNGWPVNSVLNGGSDGVNWTTLWSGAFSYTGDTLACPGADQPRIRFQSLQPGSLTFPDTTVGLHSADQNIVLTNTGNATLNINAEGVDNANHAFIEDTVNNTCSTTLAAGASCHYAIIFEPGVAGPAIGTFTIGDNSSAGSTQTVTLFGYGVTATNTSYTTSFPNTENPVSQNHNWVNGGSCSDSTLCIGLPFGYPGSHNMQTTVGKIFGTQTGTSGCSSTSLSVCDDSAAALVGSWTPDQEITATVFTSAFNSSTEIEQHLRSNIPFGKGKLYEVDIRNTSTSTSSSFFNIARWNGDGSFTSLCVNNGTQFGIANGDVIHSTIAGSNPTVIKVYKNNVLMVTCNDNTTGQILTGNPGLGAYQNLGTSAATEPTFGWQNITAVSDGTGTTSGGGGTTTFSVTNEPPPTWYSYTNSNNLFNKPLPADKMSHLAVPSNYGIATYTSDQIAQATLTEDGHTPVPTFSSSPGTSDIYIGYALFDSPASDGTAGTSDANTPVYYSASTDPWYKLQSANGSTATVIMRAPNAAMGTHPCANTSRCDSLLEIWDQTLGVYADMYGSVTGPLQLPNASGCGSSPSTACLFNLLNQQSGAIAPSTNNDWDTTLVNTTVQGVTERLGSSGSNLGGKYAGKPDGITPTTFNEQMAGQIFHAMSGGLGCTNADGKPVFPASITAWVCGSTGSSYTLPNGGRNIIPNGALLFCDYTDAQIASMGLDTLQKGFITALCHYGVYPDVTSNYEPSGALQLIGEDSQSGLAYRRITGAQHPIFNWIATTQHIGATGGGTLTANRLAASQFCCGTNNAPPQSQYRMSLPMAWGLPLMTCNSTGDSGCSTRHDASGRACASSPGCDISGHVHWLDPCAVAGMAGISGTGVPAACVGDLYVTLAGSQQGTISSSPAGINCDHVTSCNIAEANNTSITLTATPAAGHTFIGWSGACSGTGTCVVAVNGTQGVKQVTATFN